MVGQFRSDINVLRGFAILSVLIFHYFPKLLPGGYLGVDVFFVISGYLIAIKLFSTDDYRIAFQEFYIRRFIRIYPVLLLVIFFSIVAGWMLLFADEFYQLSRHIVAGSFLVSNFLLSNEAGYFDAESITKPLMHLWSLSVEWHFYIIAPFIFFINRSSRSRLIIVVALLASSLFSYLYFLKISPDSSFYYSFLRFWEILFGGLVAWLVYYRNLNLNLKGVIFLSTFLIVCGISIAGITSHPSFASVFIVVLGSSLFILSASNLRPICGDVIYRLFSYLGRISFPLYLWHWVIISFGGIVIIDFFDNATYILASLVLVFFLSHITHCYVELRIRDLSRVFIIRFLLVALLLSSFCGIAIYMNSGFKGRPIDNFIDHYYSVESKKLELRLSKKFKYLNDESANLKKPIVLMLGDSHLRSWSVAFNQYIRPEFDVVSLSYLECSVHFDSHNKTFISPKSPAYAENCNILREFLSNDEMMSRVVMISLVSYRPFEYKNNLFRWDLIRDLVSRAPVKDIFVFGNYFQLSQYANPSCERLMVRSKSNASICLKKSDYPSPNKNNLSPDLYPFDLNFKFIDPIVLTCVAGLHECRHSNFGVPFMLDWNHLTFAFNVSLFGDILDSDLAYNDLGLGEYFYKNHLRLISND